MILQNMQPVQQRSQLQSPIPILTCKRARKVSVRRGTYLHQPSMRPSPSRWLQALILRLATMLVRHAVESAPTEVRYLPKHMPPQPKEKAG